MFEILILAGSSNSFTYISFLSSTILDEYLIEMHCTQMNDLTHANKTGKPIENDRLLSTL